MGPILFFNKSVHPPELLYKSIDLVAPTKSTSGARGDFIVIVISWKIVGKFLGKQFSVVSNISVEKVFFSEVWGFPVGGPSCAGKK